MHIFTEIFREYAYSLITHVITYIYIYIPVYTVVLVAYAMLVWDKIVGETGFSLINNAYLMINVCEEVFVLVAYG